MPWSSSLAYTVAGASSTWAGLLSTWRSSVRSTSDSARGWAWGARSGVGGGGLWRWRRYQRARASPTAAHPARTPTSGTSSAAAWSIISSRPRSPGRCRWRAAPTAPRAFPGPRSPCGPCPALPAGAGSPCAAGRPAARGGQPAGAPPAWPAPPAPRGHAACATPRSATCTGPRAAAAHPCSPCPAARTPPGSAPCTSPSTAAAREHARGPQDLDRCCRPSRQPGRAHSRNDWSWWSPGNSSPPSQLNDSAAPSASLEVDTEGVRSPPRPRPRLAQRLPRWPCGGRHGVQLALRFRCHQQSCFTGSPDPRQHPFGSEHRSYPASYPGAADGGSALRRPVSWFLSAAGIRLLDLPAPAEDWPSLRSAYQADWPPGPHRGCRVPHPLCQPLVRRLELLNRWAERAGRSSPVTMTSNQSLNAHAQTGAMDETTDPNPEVLERARGPRRYAARYKARILEEYERLDKAGKGALLRREGLYTSLISEWRKQRDRGALQALATPAGRQPADPRDREVARLRKQNQRLAGELDKACKVIEVQGVRGQVLMSFRVRAHMSVAGQAWSLEGTTSVRGLEAILEPVAGAADGHQGNADAYRLTVGSARLGGGRVGRGWGVRRAGCEGGSRPAGR